VPKGGKIGEALAYGLNHWDGLTRFLDDGRIEIDSNTVERSIRPLALNRKYVQARIIHSCGAACAESPVDRRWRNALSASSCT
jgi:hypothetical protein